MRRGDGFAGSHTDNEYSCAHGAQRNVLYMLLYSVHVYCYTQLTWGYLCSDGRWLLCCGRLWVRPGGFGLTAVVVHPGNVVHGHEAVHTHPPPRVHKYLGITNNRNRVGNGITFRKIPRNRLGTVSVIPRKKVLIPRQSEFCGRTAKITSKVVFLDTFFEIFGCRNLFWVVFSTSEQNSITRVCFYFCSTERNPELFSLPRKGSEWNSESLLIFLFLRTEFWVVFFFTEGSKRNSESLLLFLFHRTEFRVVFSSTEGSETEFQEFSVPQKGSEFYRK